MYKNRELTKKDFHLLSSLLTMKQSALHVYLYNKLKTFYVPKKIYQTKNYILVEGDIPIILLAHLDTVDEAGKNYQLIYDKSQGIATGLYSLGFDDKAGVAAILKLLVRGYRPHIIFCHDEEIGCLGSEALITDFSVCPLEPFPKYMIQIDRRGTNDCVFYDDDNKKFISYIESFGYYKEAMGSFTDIATIAPQWLISGVNLSTGYFNEHTSNEYLKVPAWYRTIDEVARLLDNAETADYFTYEESPTSWRNYYKYGYYDYDYGVQCCCDCCGAFVDELYEVNLDDGTVGVVCKDCANKNCEICGLCGEFYLPDKDGKDGGLCPICRGEINEYEIQYRGHKE